MSDRQTPSTMELLHASIVRPDGTVPAVDRSPSPWWRNSQVATRGAYRDDQHAGVDNSVQPTRGEPRCGGHGDLPLHGDVHAPGNRHIRVMAYGGPLDGEVVTLAGGAEIFKGPLWGGRAVLYQRHRFVDCSGNTIYAIVLQGASLPEPHKVWADWFRLHPQGAI
ncbi:hypothetical protein [Stenotrophomonas sp. B2]|uniref:hypothetical protein n=1 Tax=Stenotrophomonas sp. B2 TaxID=1537778 RepID=UPI001876D2DD|nr:hypothetical protein [Stenotrophomonas sp. B2]MBE5272128.1 hypothetical protein [Stenotrophomonas sp. B2]